MIKDLFLASFFVVSTGALAYPSFSVSLTSAETQPNGCYGVAAEGDCLVYLENASGRLLGVTPIPKHPDLPNAKATAFEMYRNDDRPGNVWHFEAAKYMFKYIDPTSCPDPSGALCREAVGFTYLEPYDVTGTFCVFDFTPHDARDVYRFGFYMSAIVPTFYLPLPGTHYHDFFAPCHKP